MSGFPEDSWIRKYASEFSLGHYVVGAEVYGDSPPSIRYVIGKGGVFS